MIGRMPSILRLGSLRTLAIWASARGDGERVHCSTAAVVTASASTTRAEAAIVSAMLIYLLLLNY